MVSSAMVYIKNLNRYIYNYIIYTFKSIYIYLCEEQIYTYMYIYMYMYIYIYICYPPEKSTVFMGVVRANSRKIFEVEHKFSQNTGFC